MANKTNPIVLQGIIEADETYIGGKKNNKEDRELAKRGRGTSKTAVIGAVERGGQVVAEVAKGLTGRAILEFIRRVVNVKESELMTDEYHAYNALSSQLKHHVINRQEQYVDGDKHTNTIEGFWSLLKRAWYEQHHHYSVDYTPLMWQNGATSITTDILKRMAVSFGSLSAKYFNEKGVTENCHPRRFSLSASLCTLIFFDSDRSVFLKFDLKPFLTFPRRLRKGIDHLFLSGL